MTDSRFQWLTWKNVKHFLSAVVITLVLLVVIGWLIRWYTRQGDVVCVPVLTGLTMAEVAAKQIDDRFEVKVIDSVFDIEKKKGSIVMQDPPAGSIVKRHRTIYLTLVAMLPEQVQMPNLSDMTLRQATAVLETFGLKVGRLKYVPDIAKNAVLRQSYKGKPIEAGEMVKKGEKIDLVLGEGMFGGSMKIPNLLGKTRSEAIEIIQNALFVVGDEKYLDEKDDRHNRVYKQSPVPYAKGSHNQGDLIDLVYRSDKKYDFESLLKQWKLDSIRASQSDSLDSE